MFYMIFPPPGSSPVAYYTLLHVSAGKPSYRNLVLRFLSVALIFHNHIVKGLYMGTQFIDRVAVSNFRKVHYLYLNVSIDF